MTEFILMIRGGDSSPITDEERQAILGRYRQWTESLRQRDKLLVGVKLTDGDGRIISKRGNQLIVDGPFAETKETIGGYYHIEAESYAEAIAIAQECPVFARGGYVEIRHIEN